VPPSSLHRRLGRLEVAAAPRGRGCPECGHEPGGPVRLCVAPPRVIGSPDDPNDDPSLDVCAACGFPRVLRVPPPRKIRFDDDDVGAANGRPAPGSAFAGVGEWL
jgi:hypothetical protein